MRVRPYLSLSSAIFLVAAAACSEVTGPSGVLNADQSAALAVQLGTPITTTASGSSGIAADLIPSGASYAASSWSITLANKSVPCPQGGTTTVSIDGSGTVDQTTHSLQANITGSQQPNQCGFMTKGKVVVLTATSPITTTVALNIVNGVPVGLQTVTVNGNFSYTLNGGASQSCSVDYTAASDYTKNTSTVTGTFCNTTLNYSGPIPSSH